MSLSFAHPWLLLALLPLPLLWWLLRITPPAPKHVVFPPIRLLADLPQVDSGARKTPPWLLLLRLLILVLAILGLAAPSLTPKTETADHSPPATCLAVIDNGWASATTWQDMRDTFPSQLEDCLDVRLIFLARGPDGAPPSISAPMTPRQAASALSGNTPHPWPVDETAALDALDAFPFPGDMRIVWLSSGTAAAETDDLAKTLARLGTGTVLSPESATLPHLIQPPRRSPEGLSVSILRETSAGDDDGFLHVYAQTGKRLQAVPFHFADGEKTARLTIPMTAGTNDPVARLVISGETSAGATYLTDAGERDIKVGLAATNPADRQSYLGDALYIERALAPFYPLATGTIAELAAQKSSIIFLPDSYGLTIADIATLAGFVEAGGTLVRIAGENMAGHPDALLPTPLRGERRMDGKMGWGAPEALAPMPEASPLSGITPDENATVSRQLLAEPSGTGNAETWARLADKTPIITARMQGRGWLVLLHTNLHPDWSRLALSGTFETILKRLAGLGQISPRDRTSAGPLAPVMILDGFGTLIPPPPTVRTLPGTDMWTPGPAHPPGLYGPYSTAVNMGDALDTLSPLPELPGGLVRKPYGAGETPPMPLAALLLGMAFFLLLCESLASLHVRGLLFVLACLALCPFPTAHAEHPARTTHLAYVKTGDATADDISKSGLESLARFLGMRTSLAGIEVSGVTPGVDELSFYPILYWPVDAGPALLADDAAQALARYMGDGGLLVADTRGHKGESQRRLAEIATRIGIPPLAPVPAGHVLRRSFYLLDDFPGRFAGNTVYIAAEGGAGGDGITTILAGENDWAGAWAATMDGRPRLPVMPGGERQREMAYRFGTNLVMMALTGNYKADQVHLPAIMNRLDARRSP